MIDESILPAIRARLAAAFATPPIRYRPLVVDCAALGWLDDARAARLASFRTVFRIGKDSIALAETLRDFADRSQWIIIAIGSLARARHYRVQQRT